MGITIKDINEYLLQEDWSIRKDPAFTCRRFIMTSPKSEDVPVRYTPTTSEMFEEIKLSIPEFVKSHQAEARTTGPLKKKSTKIKRTGSSNNLLEKRRLAKASQTKTYAETDIQANIGDEVHDVNIASTEVIELVEPIDFDVKVPKTYEHFYFPTFNKNVVTRLKMGRNVFLSGPAGCGKTEYVYGLAGFFDTKVVRVNFNVGTTEQHLIGRMTATAGETKFIYGLLTLAMIHGWWIIFDEIDYAMPEHMSVLQPVLEGNPLIITQNKGETIVPHENFRAFGTANTKGRGDDTQGYTGTNFLNMAFLDRWSIFEMDYTKQEPNIMGQYIEDDVLIGQINQYFELLRTASYQGELNNSVFSTRRMIQLCESLNEGESLKDALTYELWSRYDEGEVGIMKEFANDVWDKETYLKGNWAVGSPHFEKEPIADDVKNQAV